MRKLNFYHLPFCQLLVFFVIIGFGHPSVFAAYQQLPVDTSLAEQFVRQAKAAPKDSTLYFYEKALAIYKAGKETTQDTTIWKRYFEIGNLWAFQLNDKNQGSKEVLDFRKEAIEKFGEKSIVVGNNYYTAARILDINKQYDSALDNYQKAIDIYKTNAAALKLIKSYNLVGILYKIRKSKHTEAFSYYELAIAQSENFYGVSHPETTNLYYYKMKYLYNLGKYQDALTLGDTILSIGATLDTPNIGNLGAVNLLFGNIHYKQSNYEEAVPFYEKAKSLYEQDSLQFSEDLASCIGNLGAVSIELGDFEKANKLFIRAAELKKAKLGENSGSLAYTYYNIGDGFAQQGDYQSALDYLFKSVRILRKVNGENHPDVAYVYNAVGTVYRQTGEWAKAMEYYEKILAIRKNTNSTDHPDMARDYDQIGFMHQQNGEIDQAKEAYEKALTIREKTLNPENKSFADSYRNLASIHQTNKEFEQADELLLKSLAIREKTVHAYHPEIANIFLQLANGAKLQGDYDKALNYYQTALVRMVPEFEAMSIHQNPTVVQKFPFKPTLLNILYQKGLTSKEAYLQNTEDKALLATAYQTLKTGSELSDLIRQDFQSDFSKKALLKKASNIYNELVEVGMLQYSQTKPMITEDALFALMEKSKSMLLLEAVNDESAKNFAGIPTTALDQEIQLKKQIAFFESQLVSLKEKCLAATDKKVVNLEEKLFQFRQKYQQFIASIEQDYPQYFQLKHDNRLATIEDIQKHLPNDSTALLQYTLSDELIYVMGITKQGAYLQQYAIDSTFFNQLRSVKQFLNTNPNQQSKQIQTANRKKFTLATVNLYQQLLAPSLQKMGSLKELIIIPDGVLNYLPFEALITKAPTPPYDAFDQLDYVIYKHTIHYEYSATLWWRNRQNTTSYEPSFAGFAPLYQGKEMLASRGEATRSSALGLFDRSATYSPLKYNQTEVQELAKNLNGATILGEAATEGSFKKTASQYGVLHLAMHAFMDDKNPNFSHLVFAKEKDTLEDRYLYAYELYNMQLNADLAVLSACETGGGQLQKGEGVMSLSRAFKYAGVPNIIMSFWKADDFYTKNLMMHFYDFLQNGDKKNKALRQAKLKQLATAKDNKEAAHPYYWANFVLVGDAQPIHFSNNNWGWWIGGGFLLFLAIGWFWKVKNS